MSAKITKWSAQDETGEVIEFLARPAFDPAAEEAARTVLADVRASGDKAVTDDESLDNQS